MKPSSLQDMQCSSSQDIFKSLEGLYVPGKATLEISLPGSGKENASSLQGKELAHLSQPEGPGGLDCLALPVPP